MGLNTDLGSTQPFSYILLVLNLVYAHNLSTVAIWPHADTLSTCLSMVWTTVDLTNQLKCLWATYSLDTSPLRCIIPNVRGQFKYPVGAY